MVMVHCGHQRYAEKNGTWRVRLKARVLDRDATLSIVPDGPSPKIAAVPLPVGNTWKTHEMTLKIAGIPEPTGPKDNPSLQFLITASGGRVFVDDIVIWKESLDKNPTIFRDDFVNMLKTMRVGVVRKLVMGDTLRDALSPRIESYRCTNNLTRAVGPFQNRNQ